MCPRCGNPVPERETFAGRGGLYLLVLFGISCLILVLFVVADRLGFGGTTLPRLYSTGWIWLYVAVIATPLGIGLYYWAVLRAEEVTVTDRAISRRSHWGNEYLEWADVVGYEHHMLPLRQTRLGRVTWFSRFFPRQRSASLALTWPGSTYELTGRPGDEGNAVVMRLEPGTIDDMAWLLKLIEERVGPPTES